MCAGSQILWKKAEPNHQRVADNWFCNFRSWHTHQLGCICQTNSCKQWKPEVTKRTLAGVQRPHGTALAACHLVEPKPPDGSRMTLMARNNWPSTPYSRKTSLKVSLHELGQMLFQDRRIDKPLPWFNGSTPVAVNRLDCVTCLVVRSVDLRSYRFQLFFVCGNFAASFHNVTGWSRNCDTMRRDLWLMRSRVEKTSATKAVNSDGIPGPGQTKNYKNLYWQFSCLKFSN